MLALQVAIGALNDEVDAPLDALEKPGKPIPAGLVARPTATRLAALAAVAGLLLSAPSGWGTVAVAAAGLALGFVYDLRLSRTGWSWLPLALALPLVPVHAWLGTTGGVPPGLAALVPVAVLAGAGLALANGLVDVERDTRAGRFGVVVAIGRRRAWSAHAGVMITVVTVAALVAPPVSAPGVLRALRWSGVVLGSVAVALGAAALLADRADVRERGWELEAIGVLAFGLAWLAGTAGGGDA
jgi:4-hydroxybenzoate polyprenyltransferase